MGLLDRFRKKQVTASYEDAGRLLLSVAVQNAESFLQETLPEISESLDIDFDFFNPNTLRSEIMILCIWAATKALEGDDSRLINNIHSFFVQAYDPEVREDVKEIFNHRCYHYNDAWDEESGDNQSVLSLNILSQLLTEGKPNKDLLNFTAISLVQLFVFNTMGNVLDARKRIRLSG